MSAGVTFSIRAAQVRMGVWLQVNCNSWRRRIRVSTEGSGYQGHAPAPYTLEVKVLTEG